MDTMIEMRRAVYTKEVLLDIINKYLTQIERSAEEHPKVVLDDIRLSMEYVLEVNGYKR